MVIVAYHLPNLENVIFRHTTNHPGLIRIPSEVRNLCSMTAVNELQEHTLTQLTKMTNTTQQQDYMYLHMVVIAWQDQRKRL